MKKKKKLGLRIENWFHPIVRWFFANIYGTYQSCTLYIYMPIATLSYSKMLSDFQKKIQKSTGHLSLNPYSKKIVCRLNLKFQRNHTWRCQNVSWSSQKFESQYFGFLTLLYISNTWIILLFSWRIFLSSVKCLN